MSHAWSQTGSFAPLLPARENFLARPYHITVLSASPWIEWALSDGDLEAREPTRFKIVKLEL